MNCNLYLFLFRKHGEAQRYIARIFWINLWVCFRFYRNFHILLFLFFTRCHRWSESSCSLVPLLQLNNVLKSKTEEREMNPERIYSYRIFPVIRSVSGISWGARNAQPHYKVLWEILRDILAQPIRRYSCRMLNPTEAGLNKDDKKTQLHLNKLL